MSGCSAISTPPPESRNPCCPVPHPAAREQTTPGCISPARSWVERCSSTRRLIIHNGFHDRNYQIAVLGQPRRLVGHGRSGKHHTGRHYNRETENAAIEHVLASVPGDATLVMRGGFLAEQCETFDECPSGMTRTGRRSLLTIQLMSLRAKFGSILRDLSLLKPEARRGSNNPFRFVSNSCRLSESNGLQGLRLLSSALPFSPPTCIIDSLNFCFFARLQSSGK